MKKVILFLLLTLCVEYAADAQSNLLKGGGIGGGGSRAGAIKNGKILDDSTKQVYGPTTTKFTYEKHIRYNQPQYYTIDTLIDNFHRFDYWSVGDYLYQDLGNIGTAITPIYYQMPETIGNTVGFNSYNLYFVSPDQVRYYDSKSPFSELDVVLGGGGRSTTEIKYSRNVKPHWNIGFDYRGLFIDKQVQRNGRGDRNVSSVAYDAYTHYKYKEVYELMANFSRNSHKVFESGGVDADIEGNNDKDTLFFLDNTAPLLEDVQSNELRTNIHLFHQYKLSDLAQVYHSIDRTRQVNDFLASTTTTDEDGNIVLAPTSFFEELLIDSTNTNNRTIYRVLQNELGVKGDVGPTFYNFYYKARKVEVNYMHLGSDSLNLDELESYAGFNVRLQKDSSLYISGFGEALVAGDGDRYKFGDIYKIGGEINSRWLQGRLQRVINLPAYITRAYSGNHNEWENSFSPTESTELYGRANLDLDNFIFQPFASLKSIENYIYFDREAAPAQLSSAFEVLSVGFDLHLRFLKHIHLKDKFIYTDVNEDGEGVYRVPELFNNLQLYYENVFFQGNLQMQIGVDTQWKSTYKANAYDPILQQFYVQDGFDINSFPNVDVFFNAKINRGRVFLKYNNLISTFDNKGYLTTPYYPGIVNLVDFGFQWAFYD